MIFSFLARFSFSPLIRDDCHHHSPQKPRTFHPQNPGKGLHPRKFNSEFAPEKWWLEDYPFLLGWSFFRGNSHCVHTTCCPGIGVIHVTNLDAPLPHRICHHMQMPTPLRSTSFGELRELNRKVVFLEFQGDKTHPSISCCMCVFVCFFVLLGFAFMYVYIYIYMYITEGGSNLKGTLMFPFLGDDKLGEVCWGVLFHGFRSCVCCDNPFLATYRWWQLKYFYVHPLKLGRKTHFDWYFSNGVVETTT